MWCAPNSVKIGIHIILLVWTYFVHLITMWKKMTFHNTHSQLSNVWYVLYGCLNLQHAFMCIQYAPHKYRQLYQEWIRTLQLVQISLGLLMLMSLYVHIIINQRGCSKQAGRQLLVGLWFFSCLSIISIYIFSMYVYTQCDPTHMYIRMYVYT